MATYSKISDSTVEMSHRVRLEQCDTNPPAQELFPTKHALPKTPGENPAIADLSRLSLS